MKSATDKPIKININSGPGTVASWCEDQYYGDAAALRADVAEAFNAELRWLARHGASVIQVTEQALPRVRGPRRVGVRAMKRAARGVAAHLVWHMCYGNARGQDSAFPAINARSLEKLFASGGPQGWTEIHSRPRGTTWRRSTCWRAGHSGRTPSGNRCRRGDEPARGDARGGGGPVRTALRHVPAERLVVSTDCGLYQLPRDLAFRKLRNLVAGTRIVRVELDRSPAGTA